MYETLFVSDAHMEEWTEICKGYAKMVGAKLLFVNNTSFGLEYDDGRLQHIYVNELVDYLGGTDANSLCTAEH